MSTGARRTREAKPQKKANVLEKKPKKPSGSAYRKRRRAQLAEARGVAGQLIRMPYVGRLETLNDWRTQIARIYRRAVTGELPEYLATKLTYIATAGATLAKAADELKELQQLREQLAALQGTPVATMLTRTERDGAINGELLAAGSNGEDDTP